jgi:hypothetical protein
MTARVHKLRLADARPLNQQGWNLRGRIDGTRESLTTVRTKETQHGQS